ncbi:hypothetical protein [Parasitella parasitica]|uniref:Bud emergence protein 1 n=1 Tax=Parasitella parasitica TaxID=35722 RepID=A0A0B7NQN3_9FUNG|nr:hypothetical protein [Parasitella parasitica]
MFLSIGKKKSLRRRTKAKISTPVAQVNALESPKKIIKALYDYQAKGPQEISFKKGDFFHVTGRENDTDWFEACNPASNLKGIVPVPLFQVIDKTDRSLAVDRPSSSSTASSSLTSELDSGFSDMSIQGHSKKKHQIYGVVMYDFKAERPDELEAQAGEAIVVIAQSNHEWFVAKPIGRLGGPGLIPVSFVQVRDALTGELIDQNEPNSTLLPSVDDWKKMTQSYAASSIPLGVFENKSTVLGSGHVPAGTATASRASGSSSEPEQFDIVTYTSIDSYILEGDQYWFVVYARVNSSCHRILYRLYEDFYDFQINLLQKYPVEAGKADRDRILPFMPGPLTVVDDAITAERQVDLDQYCKDLLKLPRYLSESELVQKQLFGLHDGDIELDYDPRVENSDNNLTPQTTDNSMYRTPSIQPTLSLSHQLTTESNATASSTVAQQQIKIKIIHDNDIYAMKVPADCSLEYLESKVYDRIGSSIALEYKNEASDKNKPLKSKLDMEEAFVQAIQRGKLTVTAIPIVADDEQ